MDVQKLSNSLFTKTQQRVLGLLYGAPGRSFYTNEIVRIAAVGRGAVTRELVKLAESGVLKVHTEGNQKHYQANSACLVYADLVKIARKLFDVEIPKASAKAAKGKLKSVVKIAPKPAKQVVKEKAVEVKPPAYELVAEQDGKVPVEKKPKTVQKESEPVVFNDEGQLGLF